jgi:hypothetical protein
MRARRSDPTPRVEGVVRCLALSPRPELRSAPHSRRLSGVQADSSVALLVTVLVMVAELVISYVSAGGRWSRLVGVRRPGDGPETAQDRFSFFLTIG